MLRQLWRQRGAYNVVNLPLAASQDDPGSSPGRADRSADWRRHYNPALEPEFREDVGLEAWDRANWYTDRQLSSTAAAKILRKRLETYGPQKERSLQEVISRIRTEKDAVMALKAAELFRRYRASREQHTPFKNSTSKMIVQRALEVDAGEVAVQALARKDELGFNFLSLKAYRHAITYFSTKGDLKNVLKVFEVAKSQGLAPNRDMVFCILRACLDCKRPDLAYAYALEFEENGIRVSPAQRIKIEAEAGKMLPKEQAESSSDVKAATATSVTIDQEASDAEEAAARRVADTIIAAASQSSREEEEEEEGQNAGKAPETGGAASVSSTGEAEVVAKPGADAVPELAISQAAKEAEPAGAGRRAVAAVIVEPDPDSIISAVAEAQSSENSGSSSSERPALLEVEGVPGLEDAVAAKMRKLFPPKPKPTAPDLRRASSL